MDFFAPMSTTGWMVIGAAVIIVALALFSKAIKFFLKLAIVGVMLLCIIYFLHQAGIIVIPGIGNQGA